MFAKIIEDHRFRFGQDRILNPNSPVFIRMTVDNGLIGDIAIGVRDENHTDLKTVGVKDLPLSTGPKGAAVWDFKPLELAEPRYVIWNIWANYNGPSALQFTVRVEVKQDANVMIATLKCGIDAGEQVVAVGTDGLWIGAPL
jgi:hypothetical protein